MSMNEWVHCNCSFAGLVELFGKKIVGLVVEYQLMEGYPIQNLLIGDVNYFGNDERKSINEIAAKIPQNGRILRYKRVWKNDN